MRFRYFIASLLILVAVSAVWATAQSVRVERVPPRVIAGENVGFRVEGLRGGSTPVGRIVVMIEGQWVEAEVSGAAATTPLSTR
jgi:hypothetical protein